MTQLLAESAADLLDVAFPCLAADSGCSARSHRQQQNSNVLFARLQGTSRCC